MAKKKKQQPIIKEASHVDTIKLDKDLVTGAVTVIRDYCTLMTKKYGVYACEHCALGISDTDVNDPMCFCSLNELGEDPSKWIIQPAKETILTTLDYEQSLLEEDPF